MNEIKKILIDLDSILDTRIALLNHIDPVICTHVLSDTKYWLREHTNWSVLTGGKISNEEFEEAWLLRDNEILKTSVSCNIMPVLLSVLAEYHKARTENRVIYDIVLEINIHPYRLEYDEMEELKLILREHILYETIPIVFVSISLEELTPEFINKSYANVFMFEFNRWVKYHCELLIKHPCRGVTFIVPLIFEKDPSKLSVEKKKEELYIFRLLLLELIQLEFVDAKYFSIMNPNV